MADRWGNLVSYTTTIEQLFGSGIMVPEYGILLNNELTDFDAVPGGPNEVRPFKRPMSSMTPTIVFRNGKPVMTVGSPGGPTIIASVFQVIFNKLEYGMPLKAAIEEPRIYSNLYPDIRWEEGVPERGPQPAAKTRPPVGKRARQHRKRAEHLDRSPVRPLHRRGGFDP